MLVKYFIFINDLADSPAKPGIRIAVDDSLNVEYRPYYTPTKPDDVLPKKGLRGVKNPDVHNANPEKPVNTEEVKDLPIVTGMSYHIIVGINDIAFTVHL